MPTIQKTNFGDVVASLHHGRPAFNEGAMAEEGNGIAEEPAATKGWESLVTCNDRF